MSREVDGDAEDLWAVEMMVEVWKTIGRKPVTHEELAALLLEGIQAYTGITPTWEPEFMDAVLEGFQKRRPC